ncbi:hypothetical protein [Paraburkholderia steynii]|uniref:hypothetical protein n=1 Tax=Paraburkholderia steynii TaxID=1245441 RepID=UPI000B81B592|nr:hypothetical protein [Paraburkholderia steynii]
MSGDVNLSVIEYFVSVAELLAHQMHRMIALHVRGAVFAVLQNAFSELVDKLLPDLNKMAHISLKLAVSPILSPDTLEDAKTLWSLHVLLISRLQRRMADVGHLLTISIAGEDVPGTWRTSGKAIAAITLASLPSRWANITARTAQFLRLRSTIPRISFKSWRTLNVTRGGGWSFQSATLNSS